MVVITHHFLHRALNLLQRSLLQTTTTCSRNRLQCRHQMRQRLLCLFINSHRILDRLLRFLLDCLQICNLRRSLIQRIKLSIAQCHTPTRIIQLFALIVRRVIRCFHRLVLFLVLHVSLILFLQILDVGHVPSIIDIRRTACSLQILLILPCIRVIVPMHQMTPSGHHPHRACFLRFFMLHAIATTKDIQTATVNIHNHSLSTRGHIRSGVHNWFPIFATQEILEWIT
mmetsp:Transcript_23416/g.37473  ORF Transcript_23416/g.37473 Transcript_23416/m.37473 type:complete len:228 (-) Transcript_23416:506-1189(-)